MSVSKQEAETMWCPASANSKALAWYDDGDGSGYCQYYSKS